MRPDPVFGNVVEVVSDGRSRQQCAAERADAAARAAAGRRTTLGLEAVGFFQQLHATRTTTTIPTAPFATPASGRLADDWGPAAGSVRHRSIGGFTCSMLRNFAWQIDGQFASGAPYNIQTGHDDNGDLIFNDRPAGFGRNSRERRADTGGPICS